MRFYAYGNFILFWSSLSLNFNDRGGHFDILGGVCNIIMAHWLEMKVVLNYIYEIKLTVICKDIDIEVTEVM